MRYKITMITGIILLMNLLTITASASIEIDLTALSMVESSGNSNAVSFKGAKYGRGLYQISEIALKDYNQCNNTSIKPSELFDPYKSEVICRWILETRIPQLLKGYPITLESVLSAYNMGHIRAKRGIVATIYVKRYKEALNALVRC